MEALQKTGILSNLYGIRAGMSVVSLEREKMARFETQQNALTEEEKKRIDEWEVAVGRSSAAYRSKQEAIRREEAEIAEAERQMEKSLASRIFSVIGVFLLYGAMIWSFFYFLHIGLMFMDKNDAAIDAFWGFSEETDVASFEFIWWLIVKEIIPLIVLVVSWIIGLKTIRKLPKIFGDLNKRASASSRKAASEKRIEKYRNELAKLDKEFAAHKNEITQYYQAKRAELVNEYRVILAPTVKFITALEQTYGSFLDVRDWRYVDLIIFYFETGRADNMKEALQQVDHQVQANMIAQAIARAVTELRSIIFYATERVGQAMRDGWQKMSAQIKTMQNQLSAQNARLDDLVSEQKLSNALRECAEKDSMRLMEDVSYIRTHMKK